MTTKLRPLDLAEIKRRIMVYDALRAIGWRPKYQSGNKGRGPCPICAPERLKSRRFRGDYQQWYCGVCKKGGSVIDLFAEIEQVPLLEAAYDLCELMGIEPPLLRS